MSVVGNLVAILDLDSNRFVAGMRVAGRQIDAFEQKIEGAHQKLTSFNTVLTTLAISWAVGEIVKAGDEMLALDRRLNLIANSLKELGDDTKSAGEQFNWIRETALKTGSDFKAISNAWAQMAPTAKALGVDLNTVRDAILGTIGAGAAMGSSTEEMSRAFVAIRQVIGKDRLQMEELRGQLGEALPNAMLIVADGLSKMRQKMGLTGDAAKVTTAELNKLITDSKVGSKEFTEAWALGTEPFKKLAEAMATGVGAQMKNMATVLSTGIGSFMNESGLQTGLAATISTINETLDELIDRMRGSATAIAEAIGESITAVLQNIGRIADTVMPLVRAVFEVLGGAINTFMNIWNSLPPELQAMGLIGGILMGKKWGLAILAAGAFANELVSVMRTLEAEKQEGVTGMMRSLMETDAFTSQAKRSFIMEEEFGKGFSDTVQNKKLPIEERLLAVQDLMDTIEKDFKGGVLEYGLKNNADPNLLNPGNADEKELAAMAHQLQILYGLYDALNAEAAKFYNADGANNVSRTIQDLLDQFDKTMEKMRGLNAEAKKAGGAIQDMQNKNPLKGELDAKGGAFAKSTIEYWKRFEERATSAYNVVAKAQAGYEADMRRFNEQQKYFDLLGLDRARIQQAILEKAVGSLSDFKSEGKRPEDVARDWEASTAQFEEYARRLIAMRGDAQETIDQIRLKRQDEYRDRMRAAIDYIHDREIKQIEEIRASYDDVSKALVMMMTDREQFDARARKERDEIVNKVRKEAAAVFSLTEGQARLKLIEGERKKIIEDIAKAKLQGETLADEGVRQQMLVLQAEKDRVALMQQAVQLEYLRSVAGRQNQWAEKMQSLQLERENMEIQRELLQDPALRQQMLQTEITKLQLEQETLQQQAELYNSPAYTQALLARDIQQEQLEMTRLAYEWQLSMEDALALKRVEGLQALEQTLTTNIFNVLTGVQSIGDAMKNVLRDMLGGIIKFFVEWATRQALVWILQQTGLMATTGIAVGSAATIAASFGVATATVAGMAMGAMAMMTAVGAAMAAELTALYIVPATLASIMTFGGAAATGAAAVLMAVGLTQAAVQGMQAMSALGGINAGGSGLPIFHEGGIFDSGSGEGPAWLQDGEMIVPSGTTPDAIAAMLAAGVPLPSGVTPPAGALATADVGDDTAARMGGPGVQVVNYFDYQDVERHLSRNPNAIVNIIAQDNRNGGQMSKMLRRR